jgi:hypothetical protein
MPDHLDPRDFLLTIDGRLEVAARKVATCQPPSDYVVLALERDKRQQPVRLVQRAQCGDCLEDVSGGDELVAGASEADASTCDEPHGGLPRLGVKLQRRIVGDELVRLLELVDRRGARGQVRLDEGLADSAVVVVGALILLSHASNVVRNRAPRRWHG